MEDQFSTSQKRALAVFTVLAVVFTAYFLRRFFVLIVVAAVAAYLFTPLFNRLQRRFSRGASALLTLLSALAIVIIPLSLLVFLAVVQITRMVESVAQWMRRTDTGALGDRVRAVVALSPHLYREARTLEAIRAQIRDFEAGDLRSRLQRHHGAKTDALFERLVEVWTAPRAARGWGLDDLVARVRCPVLAIQGEDDEFFSAAQLDALARLVPHAQRLRLAGCGHYPHLQARREVFAAIRDFVRRRVAPPLERSPEA